jgi:hypothetical protein
VQAFGSSSLKEIAGVQARFKAPGLSFTESRLEVWPLCFPVALGFGAGLAKASFALIACIFLLLLTPFFFFRCL